MYDVVVVGGGTAGVSAAYTSAKFGLKTLLIEKKIHLGGTMTSGLVVPVMNAGASEINRDFYNILVKKMAEKGAQIDFDGNKGWFNPEVLKIVLDELLTSVGVDIRFLTSVYGVKADFNKNILSLDVQSEQIAECINKTYSNNPSVIRNIKPELLFECIKAIDDNNNSSENYRLLERIETRYVIDATGNCDVGKISGCEFVENLENDYQPISLRFIMGGVDIERFGEFLLEVDDNREVSPVLNIDGKTYVSTAYTWDKDVNWALAKYFENAVVEGDLTDYDCNYFQVFSLAGCTDSLAFNCPRILENLDITDNKGLSKALIQARESIYRLANFCKKTFPGFENAYISNIADDIGVRISRRIMGKYFYTERDLKDGKTFDNPVLSANYPIDVHSKDRNNSTLEKVGYYQLPIEALMAKDFDNLFVVGRCLSADFKAQAALRVQQSCFSMGEGVAKYIASIINQN